MNFDFSFTPIPSSTASTSLTTVYYVEADCTYNVVKNVIDNANIIILRTLHGTGQIFLKEHGEIEVKAGSLILIKHSQIKRYFCSDKTWTFWWYEFSHTGKLEIPSNLLLYVNITESELNYSRTCLRLLKKDNHYSNLQASAVLTLLLYTWQESFHQNYISSPYDTIVEKIVQFLRNNLSVNVTVKEMARMSGLSERRFRQVFEAIKNIPPKKYYNQMRMAVAEELLINTALTLADISDCLGFSSQFHFSREFLKSTGIQPSQYRKSTTTRYK